MSERENSSKLSANERMHIQSKLLERLGLGAHGNLQESLKAADWLKVHHKEIAAIIDDPQIIERLLMDEEAVLKELEERFRPTLPKSSVDAAA